MNGIGITDKSDEIQIIPKPDFAALLKVISDIRNKENILQFDRASYRTSDASSFKCHRVSQFGRALDRNANGSLVDMDSSDLDLTGTIRLESVPQRAHSMNISFKDFETLDHDGLGSKLDKLNVEWREDVNSKRHAPRFGQYFSIKLLRISCNLLIIDSSLEWWVLSSMKIVMKLQKYSHNALNLDTHEDWWESTYDSNAL